MSDTITPTIRLVCRNCLEDMICTEKIYGDYRFHCRKCDAKVDLVMGWTSAKVRI